MNKSLLISEPPLQLIPTLAIILKSSDKALMLQQIHYWLQRSNNIEEGHRWVFNSVKNWQKQFPWLTEKTVQRYLRNLCDMGLLITGNFNKANFDRTKWYRIDYDALDKMTQSIGTESPNGKGLRVPMEGDSMYQPIPIDYTETTHKTNNMFKSKKLNVADYQKEFKALWEQYPKGKKQGKQLALRSYTRWRKASKDNTYERAQSQLKKYLHYLKVQQVQTQFIKAAKTWFGNIDDEYDQGPAPIKPSYGTQNKRVEKGTDWSKQKPSAKSDVSPEKLKNFFEKFESQNNMEKAGDEQSENCK